jgi:hypothetical protein
MIWDMRQMCDEREALWVEYQNAMRAYIKAVNRIAYACYTNTRYEREVLHQLRQRIVTHCLEHGCDPDWVKQTLPPP